MTSLLRLANLILIILLISFIGCKSDFKEGKEVQKELNDITLSRKLKLLDTYFTLEVENKTGKIFYENGKGYTTLKFVKKTNDGRYIWDEYFNGEKTATLEFNDNKYSSGTFIRLKDNKRFPIEELSYTSTNNSTLSTNSSDNSDELKEVIQGSYYGVCESTDVYGKIMYTKYNIEISSSLLIMTGIFDDGEIIKESGEYSFSNNSNKDEGEIKVTFSDNNQTSLNYVEANGYYYIFLDKSYCYPTGIRLMKDSDLTDGELELYNLDKLNNSSLSYQGVDLTYFGKQTGFIKNDDIDGYVKENVGYWNSVLISPDKGVMMFLITDPTVANWLEVTDDLKEMFGQETQNDDDVPYTINDANRLPQEIKYGNAVYKRMWKSTNTAVGSLVLMWYTEGILLLISRESVE